MNSINSYSPEQVQLIKSLDSSRPIDACSGCSTQEHWWSLSGVQV